MIICPFSFLVKMYKNGYFLKLCLMVIFILGSRFWGKLCKLLMLPYEHFHNTKQSSRYFFYNLMNSVFILLPYIFPVISHRFSSNNIEVRVTYVGVIVVLSAVWMLFLLSNWKELSFRINSLPSVFHSLLYLWCYVSGYFFTQTRWPVFLIHGGYSYIGW